MYRKSNPFLSCKPLKPNITKFEFILRAAENAIERRKRREATPIDIDSVEVSKIGEVASNVSAGFNDKVNLFTLKGK